MNFNRNKREIEIVGTAKNDIFTAQSSYNKLNDDSTKSISILPGNEKLISKIEIEKPNEIETNAVNDTVSGSQMNAENINNVDTNSKISPVKLGYNSLNGINPISRYNFLIERYNEKINIYNGIKLRLIPFHKILGFIFDIYVYWVRILLAPLLMAFAEVSKKCNFKNYYLYFRFYSFAYYEGNYTNIKIFS